LVHRLVTAHSGEPVALGEPPHDRKLLQQPFEHGQHAGGRVRLHGEAPMDLEIEERNLREIFVRHGLEDGPLHPFNVNLDKGGQGLPRCQLRRDRVELAALVVRVRRHVEALVDPLKRNWVPAVVVQMGRAGGQHVSTGTRTEPHGT
jgi:hypothetical protein